jgi:IS30 family transposase
LSERPAHIKSRKQFDHWEYETVIGTNHTGVIFIVVDRKSSYPVIATVSNKTSELMGTAITKMHKPFKSWVKTLTYHN